MHELGYVTFLLFNLYLSAFYSAHVKDIVDQAEQVIAGGKDFPQAVLNLFFIINMTGL